MSEEDRSKWDHRYAEDSHRKRAQPGEFITQWIDRVSIGNALDVACGLGQKSIFLAEAGFQVDAIDVSKVGLKRARQQADEDELDINWIQHDLDQPYDFNQKYDLIMATYCAKSIWLATMTVVLLLVPKMQTLEWHQMHYTKR
jgi:2-polyprenyl-3-methyl-5-hydroxy-6-metoxy-1,4-benzoquinol methylase